MGSRSFYRLFLIICLSILNAEGAITYTNLHTQVQCNGGSCPPTPGLETTGTNLIIITASYASVATGLSMTDNKSNTWSFLTAHGTVGNVSVNLYYCINPIVGSNHSFTLTGSTIFGWVAAEVFSGGSIFDQQNGAASALASSLATGSITPSEDNELIVSGEAYFGDSTMATINSGMNITDSFKDCCTTATTGAMAYKIQTTATAINPTWTFPSANLCAVIVASFKASGGAITVRHKIMITQ